MFAKSLVVAAALVSASMVDAHMLMHQPVPYSADTLNNSPLAADGSDFPCKLRPNAFVPPAGNPNTFEIGVSQPLTFTGSATHGGGSCQISLTTDMQPSKSSNWQVIKSFEGGCPANDAGNLSGGAGAADPFTFNFTIPDGIAPGQYTLAWTWFNRIGNREMYMNCAPITVTGKAKRSESEVAVVEKRASFPPMFVANINGCMTKEGIDIRFPNPGAIVEFDGQPANLQPAGELACTGTPTFGGAGNTPGSAGSSAGSGDSSSASSGASSGGGSAPSSGSSSQASAAPQASNTVHPAPPATTSSAPAPTAQTPPPSSSSTSSSSGSSGSSSSSTSTLGGSAAAGLSGSCSPEGLWNCIGGSAFQRCAGGQWSVAQDMAPGTQCQPGQGTTFQIAAAAVANRRSSMRHRRRVIDDFE